MSTRRRARPGGASRGGLGGEQVEGPRAVEELLRAGRRRVRTLWVATSSGSSTLESLASRAAELGADVRRVDADELAALAGTDAPRGVVAHAAPLPVEDLDVLLAAPDAFVVALDGVTDPRNLGAVLRSAEGAGATGVVLARHRASPITPAATTAAAGAIEHVRIALVGGVPAALARARRASLWTVGLDADGDVELFDLGVVDQPTVLVVGAEGSGLGTLTRQRCDVVARIPMRGRLGSLNVAAAATLACYEVARRRSR